MIAVNRGFPIVGLLAVLICAASVAQQDDAVSDILPKDLGIAVNALADDREEAYLALRSGNVWGGTELLVLSLRKLPGDDPLWISNELVDESCATIRLAVYAMESLMDDAVRQQFIDTVLVPEKFPTDSLVLCRFRVAHAPTLEEADVIVAELYKLCHSTHSVVRVFSLGLLTAQYYFNYDPLLPTQAEVLETLGADYGGLEIVWEVHRAYLYYYCGPQKYGDKKLARIIAGNDGKTPAPAMAAYTSDPTLAPLREAGTTLRGDLPEMWRDAAEALGRAMTDDADPKIRYASINLGITLYKSGNADVFRAACRTLAAREGNTPDIVRATCLALGYAREEGAAGEAARWAEKLLALDRIFDPIERTLHEEVDHAIQHYAEFLAERGDRKGAIRVYESLAEKFPNSALALRCYEKADALR
jgi:hypothetical protein